MSFTILIVDDSDLIRHALRSCIEKNTEWQICGEAENGQVAVDKVQELSPNVVIMDFQMPVMNGIDAARRITKSAPNTAIVMLTMHNGEQLRREAQSAGIQEVLSKSESVADHLLAALRKVCAGSQKIIPGPAN
ncbi:MAG TPA: response regulator transcription factor [Terriglobia bacterium]|nr:response regulator transcription factor [Terriglobia bacterium]